MRYLMTTTFSWVSMWMSEARRWIALKRTESTSLMIGLASAAIRSIVRTSCPSSSSLHDLHPEVLGRLLEDPLRRLGLLQDLGDLAGRRDPDLDRSAERQLDLVDQQHARRIGHRHHDNVALAVQRHELVAEHDVDRDLPEQLGLAAELGELVERQGELLRQGTGALEVRVLVPATLQVLLGNRCQLLGHTTLLRGGPSPSPRPRSEFADFTPPGASPDGEPLPVISSRALLRGGPSPSPRPRSEFADFTRLSSAGGPAAPSRPPSASPPEPPGRSPAEPAAHPTPRLTASRCP